jgi:hypothetical protein
MTTRRKKMCFRSEKRQVTGRSALDRCLNVLQLVSVSESEDLIKLIATFLRLACRPLSEKKSMLNLSKMSCRALKLNPDSRKGPGGNMCCSIAGRDQVGICAAL